MAAPWEARNARSLHSAGRCACGIAIGIQQNTAAVASKENARLGGQSRTLRAEAAFCAIPVGSCSSGGARKNMASGMIKAPASSPK